MKHKWVYSGLGTVGMALLLATSAQAASVELSVFQTLDAPEASRCPAKVTVSEQNRPYQEGSYTIDGSANLSGLAEKFSLGPMDEFSVTWVANLKPQYRSCRATGGIARLGGEALEGPSYLRLRFTGGKVYLILDMTGMRDANNFTTVILKKGVRNGNPFWSWGGSD